MTQTGVFRGSPTTAAGTWLVGGLVGLGLAAAATGIWFQRHQTHRCLEFYGSQAARRIAAAPSVRLVLVEPAARAGRLVALRSFDVSKAPGLVHLRRGLVEDANFAWPVAGGESDHGGTRLPAEAWNVALVFSTAAPAVAPADAGSPLAAVRETAVLISLPRASGDSAPAAEPPARESSGFLAVVGQPGRLGLGRIGGGLEAWVRATLLEQQGGAAQEPRGKEPVPGSKPRP